MRNTKNTRGVATVLAAAFGIGTGLAGLRAEEKGTPMPAQSAELLAELRAYKHKIIYETWQDTNWELFMINADGSNPVNLTRTPAVDEMYPHVSPDGTKVSFIVDEGEGASKVRKVYYMNLDGTGRTLVSVGGREPCWNADGTKIVYLKSEFEEFNIKDYATKGIVTYDLKTGQHTEHPNKKIEHLYNICCSPDGKWFISTIHAGMGFDHAILAIEANGMGVYKLPLPGCRPDISPDGKRVGWGASDWALYVGDLDYSGPQPTVKTIRAVVLSTKPIEVYHFDWSPDGRYVAFSRGPQKPKSLDALAPELIGSRAPGWNICVADTTAKNRWVQLTNDGKSNKEPDWAPAK